MQIYITKRHRQLLKIILSALICLACIVNGIFALTNAEITFTSGVHTGSVKVSIKQLKLLDGQLVESSQAGETVCSGQSVSYIPRVTSERASGYVRLKGSLDLPGKTSVPLTQSNVTTSSSEGLSTGWIEKGGYFYYTAPLSNGETAEPFTELIIPSAADEAKGQTLTVNVTADIIQAENFTPDFDSETPWGQVEIQTARADDSISYGVANSQKKLDSTIVYTQAGTLECSTKDLFSGIRYHMSGDSYSDILKIRNKAKNNIRLYFRTQNTDTDLLEVMTLKISYDGNSIYEGALLSEPLGEYKELTVLGADKSGRFTFEVALPASVANTAGGNKEEETKWVEASRDKVVWQFKAVEIDSKTGKEKSDANNFQTGQNVPKVLVILLLAALLTGLYSITESIKYRKEKPDEQSR